VFGAILLALSAQHISAQFDGVGQDIVNIVVLSVALTMLLWHCIWVSNHSRGFGRLDSALGSDVQGGQRTPWALTIAVALAVLREGAETVLFVGGILTSTDAARPIDVVLSCAIGVAFGVGAGLVIYSGLSRLPTRQIFTVTNLLIAILAGSIASQLVKSLAQAGFLESGTAPLWDTSAALSPDSALGTLLHALMGYDARPSAAQLASYVAVLLLIYSGTRLMRRTARRP